MPSPCSQAYELKVRIMNLCIIIDVDKKPETSAGEEVQGADLFTRPVLL